MVKILLFITGLSLRTVAAIKLDTIIKEMANIAFINHLEKYASLNHRFHQYKSTVPGAKQYQNNIRHLKV